MSEMPNNPQSGDAEESAPEEVQMPDPPEETDYTSGALADGMLVDDGQDPDLPDPGEVGAEDEDAEVELPDTEDEPDDDDSGDDDPDPPATLQKDLDQPPARVIFPVVITGYSLLYDTYTWQELDAFSTGIGTYTGGRSCNSFTAPSAGLEINGRKSIPNGTRVIAIEKQDGANCRYILGPFFSGPGALNFEVYTCTSCEEDTPYIFTTDTIRLHSGCQVGDVYWEVGAAGDIIGHVWDLGVAPPNLSPGHGGEVGAATRKVDLLAVPSPDSTHNILLSVDFDDTACSGKKATLKANDPRKLLVDVDMAIDCSDTGGIKITLTKTFSDGTSEDVVKTFGSKVCIDTTITCNDDGTISTSDPVALLSACGEYT